MNKRLLHECTYSDTRFFYVEIYLYMSRAIYNLYVGLRLYFWQQGIFPVHGQQSCENELTMGHNNHSSLPPPPHGTSWCETSSPMSFRMWEILTDRQTKRHVRIVRNNDSNEDTHNQSRPTRIISSIEMYRIYCSKAQKTPKIILLHLIACECLCLHN